MTTHATTETTCDVLIIGSGNAGLSAAISAAQSSPQSRIHLIDKSPPTWTGGNSYFTAGAFRSTHEGLASLLPLVNNVSPDLAAKIDLPAYTAEDFMADLARVTNGRTRRDLAHTLIDDSYETVRWLRSVGVRFQLSLNRQAYEVNGRMRFWGGLALKTEEGGKGLVRDLMRAAEDLGVVFSFGTAARRLITDSRGRVTSVEVMGRRQQQQQQPGGGDGMTATYTIQARKGVILAAGGFEAAAHLRAQYLGPKWDMALVRGTPFNTGECLEMAVRDVAARTAGNWSGCHCVAWDARAPAESGDREVSNEYTKSGYPLGVMVNRRGERFIDEGSDMRNYTYAVVGRAILDQPGHVAYQIWDARTSGWLRSEEYREEVVDRITAGSLPELAQKLARDDDPGAGGGGGLNDPDRFLRVLTEYNRAVYARQACDEQAGRAASRGWNPSVKDGLSTQSSAGRLEIDKTNWALPIDQPPFLAVKVSAGITFTFGGLAVEPATAAVVSSISGARITGLYCVGEMMGGLFYDNYPGGSGLTSGAVFGRRAGRDAVR